MAKKASTKRVVPKTRAGGLWSEARFFSFVRSGLRKLSQRWPPIYQALEASRSPYTGPNKKQKWVYRCSACGQMFGRKEVEMDHIVECGSLRCLEDLPGFVGRLLCEAGGLQVLCKPCHLAKPKTESNDDG